jgi:hypothetical protein
MSELSFTQRFGRTRPQRLGPQQHSQSLRATAHLHPLRVREESAKADFGDVAATLVARQKGRRENVRRD